MENKHENMKMVYTVVERSPQKSFWVRLGVGFVNRDGSLTLRLDAVPVNGTLQVRDWEKRDWAERRVPEEDLGVPRVRGREHEHVRELPEALA